MLSQTKAEQSTISCQDLHSNEMTFLFLSIRGFFALDNDIGSYHPDARIKTYIIH